MGLFIIPEVTLIILGSSEDRKELLSGTINWSLTCLCTLKRGGNEGVVQTRDTFFTSFGKRFGRIIKDQREGNWSIFQSLSTAIHQPYLFLSAGRTGE